MSSIRLNGVNGYAPSPLIYNNAKTCITIINEKGSNNIRRNRIMA
jgi:hypothetical protein